MRVKPLHVAVLLGLLLIVGTAVAFSLTRPSEAYLAGQSAAERGFRSLMAQGWIPGPDAPGFCLLLSMEPSYWDLETEAEQSQWYEGCKDAMADLASKA